MVEAAASRTDPIDAGRESPAMSAPLAQIDEVARLAEVLRADPGGHVHRSALELRAAFDDRRAIEPAFERMRRSVRMLQRGDHDECRREFRRRSFSLDHLNEVLEDELLPKLRQVGFDV